MRMGPRRIPKGEFAVKGEAFSIGQLQLVIDEHIG
jgi:hypothetical protein